MGQSSSNRRRREENYPQNPNPNPSPSSPSSPSSNLLHPPPPPPPPPYPPNYSNPYPAPPPACSYYSHHPTTSYGPPVRYYNHFMGRSGYPGILSAGQGSGWWPSGSSSSSPWMMPGPQQLPPPYVEHQKAKTIKNDVNLHKDTIRLEPDPQNPDHHLVSFTYDSLVDGSVTIFYFAKEGADCSFSPVYPDMYMPVRITFEKGVHQKFCQPSGSGVDLGFFEYDALSKPSSDDVFPLVIYAEACPPPPLPPGENGHSKAATRAQITLAVIERKADETFLVKVVKQILWVDGERYELQEIFGLGSSAETGVDGNDDDENMGKECVICLSEPRDTAVLPCRHMCMCSECAKALRLQSNKCPICRQPVEKLMEIKVKREVEQ